MQNAFNQFENNMKYVKELDTLFLYLRDNLKLPNDLTDILRAEWVYSISALDKLIHDLIKIGMIQSFQGTRPKTQKYLAFNISLETHTSITSSTAMSLPPPEYLFEQEVVQRHKKLSFQDPDKIADGLSLIWNEPHKWQILGDALSLTQNDIRTRLKNIISRRNQIVHEADLDLYSENRNSISKSEIDLVVSFIENLSKEIYDAVR